VSPGSNRSGEKIGLSVIKVLVVGRYLRRLKMAVML
jgi:hypothetical protein